MLRVAVNFRRIAAAVFPFWVALAFCAAQTQPVAQTQPQTSTTAPFAGALISQWKGDVHVQAPGTPAATPKRGQVLAAGTVLETGKGTLVLVLRADESEVLVQPHSRIVVSEPAPGNWNAIEVFLGRVRAYIRKRTGGAPPFQMGTPSAVIAVRGTRFDVEVNGRGVSEVDVFDGLVEVASSKITAPSVLVAPGFSTRVGVGAAPETPVPTWEIRPNLDVPDTIAKLEFARERAALTERVADTEMGERSEGERNESVDEGRDSEHEN